MKKNIAVIRGDGIGPEIVDQAIKVLDSIAKKYNHEFVYTYALMGGASIDTYGEPLVDVELQKCLSSDSVLLGAVGGEKWNNVPANLRPERGLLKLRKALNVYANNRPCKVWKELSLSSPLKKEIVDKGIDFVIVRELTGGVYFGEHREEDVFGIKKATDVMSYDEKEIERIGKVAFSMAQKRRKKVCSVDKSNVLATSRLWKSVINSLAKEYPDVELSHMLVDNCAMQIVKNPSQFDVIVTENMFGDILSDEASMITGSIGMIPSSSTGDGKVGLYEPIHGSAPDIAGKDIANPIGTILSAAMMLKYSFGMENESKDIEKAVEKVLKEGYRTADIIDKNGDFTLVSCSQIGNKVAFEILK